MEVGITMMGPTILVGVLRQMLFSTNTELIRMHLIQDPTLHYLLVATITPYEESHLSWEASLLMFYVIE